MKLNNLFPTALVLACLTAACHDSDDDDCGVPLGNQAPSILFTAPLTSLTVEAGQPVEVRWIADDPDDEATTTVVAVGLDVSVVYELVVDMPEADGAEQTVVWTPSAGTEGTYRIDAISSDGEATIRASAPGLVDVGEPAALASGAAVMTDGGGIVALDTFPDGSFVVAGGISGYSNQVVTLGAGSPNETGLTSLTQDAFVAKFAPDGDFLWARQTNAVPLPVPAGQADSRALAWDVVALPDGSCVLDVGFAGTIAIDQGTATETLWSTTEELEERELLMAFDAAGNVSWVQQPYEPGESAQSENGSLTLVGNDVFALLADRGGELTFDPGGPNETVLGEDDGDLYLAAFDLAGDLIFAEAIGLTFDGSVFDPLVHAHDQGILVAATFNGTITLGPGGGHETMLTSLNDDEDDQFLACYGLDGELLWSRHVAGVPFDAQSSAIVAVGMATGEAGEVYVLHGPLEPGNYIFGLGLPNETAFLVAEEEEELVLACYEAGGELRWLQRMAADGFDDDEETRQGLAALETGGVAVVAAFYDYLQVGALLFLPETAPGLGNLFLARFDASGTLQWALNDGGQDEEVEDLLVAPLVEDRLVISGYTRDSLELGTNGPESTLLTPPLNGMYFRAVYGGDGSF